jgi:hypothetical protein
VAGSTSRQETRTPDDGFPSRPLLGIATQGDATVRQLVPHHGLRAVLEPWTAPHRPAKADAVLGDPEQEGPLRVHEEGIADVFGLGLVVAVDPFPGRALGRGRHPFGSVWDNGRSPPELAHPTANTTTGHQQPECAGVGRADIADRADSPTAATRWLPR